MKYACAKCQQFFHIKRNGVMMEEGMPVSVEEPKVWKPYKIFLADLYECRKCGTELMVPSHKPISEHFMAEYEHVKDQFRIGGRLMPMIEDC